MLGSAGMDLAIIPCLSDNYAYLLRRPGAKNAVVVDASEAAPVRAVLQREGLLLEAILSTHHHADHVGGNRELAQCFPGVRVFGFRTDRGRLPGLTDPLDDGAEFEVAGFGFRALHIPGHTQGALAYLTEDRVFTGDTLFVAGCGRLFEGTPEQMVESLNGKLASLPDGTRIYCGHEYTQKNLAFARWVEPENSAIQAKAERVRELRERGLPSVPSTIGEERATNPFLRLDRDEILDRFGEELGKEPSAGARFWAMRRAKDRF